MSESCKMGHCYHLEPDPNCLKHGEARRKIQTCCRCGRVAHPMENTRMMP